jgi:hypothetical protein
MRNIRADCAQEPRAKSQEPRAKSQENFPDLDYFVKSLTHVADSRLLISTVSVLNTLPVACFRYIALEAFLYENTEHRCIFYRAARKRLCRKIHVIPLFRHDVFLRSGDKQVIGEI